MEYDIKIFILSLVHRRKQPPKVFYRKRLKNFTKFTEKHLHWNLFLVKLQALALQLRWKSNSTQVFSCEFSRFLRTTYLQKTSGRPLLHWQIFQVLHQVKRDEKIQIKVMLHFSKAQCHFLTHCQKVWQIL